MVYDCWQLVFVWFSSWVNINSCMLIWAWCMKLDSPINAWMYWMWWPTCCLCLIAIMLYLISQNMWHANIVVLGKQTIWMISMLLMQWIAMFWLLKHDDLEYLDPRFGIMVWLLLWYLRYASWDRDSPELPDYLGGLLPRWRENTQDIEWIKR